MWGLLPVYWKALQTLPASRIVGHRIVWSFVFLAGLVLARGEWKPLQASARGARVVGIYLLAAVILSLNWFTYIWAVNSGRIIEASLGYFINPLVNVLLGLMVLRERLRPLQWLAVGLAGAAVVFLTVQHGSPPWVALVLAISFGFYGLVKKQAPLGALHGLTLETALLVGPAFVYLARTPSGPAWDLPGPAWSSNALLAGTGVVTALPLLLFAHAARTTQLSTLGLLQYISPTCGLALGVCVYGEPFPLTRALGFLVIWIALLVYSLDALRQWRR
jgi:chloramphenicol-sensitive protein RarD